MQITRQSEYAIKTILELSKNYGESISAKEISVRQDVPEFFLKKTVQVLARAGMVQTQRGANGGVKLLVKPQDITVADVIKVIEGNLALNVCLAEGSTCPNQGFCQVRKILLRTQQAMEAELSKETFADLAGLNTGKELKPLEGDNGCQS